MRKALVSYAKFSIYFFISGASSLNLVKSILVKTMTNGLDWKSGLMFLKRATYCSMVYPQVSEISSKKRIQAFKCARAVIACISIVFLSSSGWSRIPGVSIIYHLAYL
jgi:hypothetical protein